MAPALAVVVAEEGEEEAEAELVVRRRN